MSLRWAFGVGCFIVAAATLSPRIANAEEATAVAEAKPPATKWRDPLAVGLDVVVGLSTRPTVLELPPAGGFVAPGNAVIDSGHRAGVFLLRARYDFGKVGLAVRLPILAGRVYDNESPRGFGDSRFYAGNLELSLEAPRQVSPQVRYSPSIALLAPTAGGTAFERGDDVSSPSYDRGGAQRYSLGLAAAYALGGEENALFLNHRLGIVPRVGFDFTFGHAEIGPFLKVPIMIAVQDSTNEPLRIEVSGGVRFAYWLGPVSVGIRALGNVPIASRDSLRDPWFFIEPELRFQVTPSFRVHLSGLLPLAGPSTIYSTPAAASVRGGFAITF
ncbi:hypothetical protein BH09MYX1_BH09MYX1_49330 [soil metagenome]